MKYKRILGVSLLCILLTSMILVGALAISRVSKAYSYATRFAEKAKISVGSSANLSLTMYSDPEPARQTLDIFQYVTAENIEWRTTTTDLEGNAINVDVKLASVGFEKLSEDNYRGAVEGLDVYVAVGDLIYVLARADEVNVSMTFWTYMDMFPALNATGVATGDVELSFFVAVLPIQGLAQALYEYKGDRFVISWCIIKPIELAIEKPSDGDRVSGDVKIQASVKAVPEISVEHVEWWTEGEKEAHFGGPMDFNETSGLWEAVWHSYEGGNGRYNLAVRAEGVERKPGVQEFRYPIEDRINVEVDNPWVESIVIHPDGWEEWFDGLGIELEYETWTWSWQTPFNLGPWIGLSLTAPGAWMDEKIIFDCWMIEDNVISEDPRLTITEEIFNLLSNGDGKARPLKCIYVESTPP